MVSHTLATRYKGHQCIPHQRERGFMYGKAAHHSELMTLLSARPCMRCSMHMLCVPITVILRNAIHTERWIMIVICMHDYGSAYQMPWPTTSAPTELSKALPTVGAAMWNVGAACHVRFRHFFVRARCAKTSVHGPPTSRKSSFIEHVWLNSMCRKRMT